MTDVNHGGQFQVTELERAREVQSKIYIYGRQVGVNRRVRDRIFAETDPAARSRQAEF